LKCAVAIGLGTASGAADVDNKRGAVAVGLRSGCNVTQELRANISTITTATTLKLALWIIRRRTMETSSGSDYTTLSFLNPAIIQQQYWLR
jgi:hypothetical protein